jgi:deoxyribose-phosphate aldolase
VAQRPAPEKLIDHTLLKAGATSADIERLCAEAAKYGFIAVCVHPIHVERCVRAVGASDVRVGTVAGFPFGAQLPEAKAFGAVRAIELGAREIDMVLDISALLDGRLEDVAADIRTVRKACEGVVLKVILETCYLDDAQKRIACRVAMAEGADFVKTSTGLGPAGATPEDVRLMRETVGPEMGVKAAGGIRDAATFWTMVRAGGNRIGTSSGVNIIEEIRSGGRDG